MAPVVLDTDVASLIIKNRLPAGLGAQVARRRGQTALTFVNIGELTKWSIWRGWENRAERLRAVAGSATRAAGQRGRRARVGELAGYAVRRGRPGPANDMWVAACCLTLALPLATLQ